MFFCFSHPPTKPPNSNQPEDAQPEWNRETSNTQTEGHSTKQPSHSRQIDMNLDKCQNWIWVRKLQKISIVWYLCTFYGHKIILYIYFLGQATRKIILKNDWDFLRLVVIRGDGGRRRWEEKGRWGKEHSLSCICTYFREGGRRRREGRKGRKRGREEGKGVRER